MPEKKLGTDIWNDYCVHCFDSNTHLLYSLEQCACIAYAFHLNGTLTVATRTHNFFGDLRAHSLVAPHTVRSSARMCHSKDSLSSSSVQRKCSLFAFTFRVISSPLTRWWTFWIFRRLFFVSFLPMPCTHSPNVSSIFSWLSCQRRCIRCRKSNGCWCSHNSGKN